MKQVRYGVFETNSSSTHSITFANYRPRRNDIPKNTRFEILPFEDGPMAYGDESHNDTIRYVSQIGKLRYLVYVLVSIINNDTPEKYFTEYKGKIDDWQYPATEAELSLWFNELVNLKYFRWLADVVKKRTGTTIYFDEKTYRTSDQYFPFFETVYDENSNLKTVFGFTDESFENEEQFKKIIDNIIFNDEVVILDEDSAYGSWEPDTSTEV